jgi:hypothetical protein
MVVLDEQYRGAAGAPITQSRAASVLTTRHYAGMEADAARPPGTRLWWVFSISAALWIVVLVQVDRSDRHVEVRELRWWQVAAVSFGMLVNGHCDLPGGGQQNCPAVATGTAQRRPVDLPAG